MVNVRVACSLLCLVWIAESQVSPSTTLSPETDDPLFTKIMENIVSMSEEVEKLTEIIPVPSSKENEQGPVIFIAGLGDAMQAAGLGLQIAQFAYQVNKDLKDAAAAEKQRVIEEKRFQDLKQQNERLINKVDAVRDAVVEAAEKIVDTTIRNEFNDNVKIPMKKLYGNYDLMMRSMLEEDFNDFKDACEYKENKPKEIMVALETILGQMYETQLGSTFEDEAFHLIQSLQNEVIHEFAIVYPTCTVMINGPGDNATNIERLKNVQVLVENAQKASEEASNLRSSQFWKPEFIKNLVINNDDVGINVSERTKKIYQFIVDRYSYLREPDSNEDTVYLVAINPAYDDIYQIKHDESIPTHNFVVGNVLIHGQPKPEQLATCDFEIGANAHISDELQKELCHMREGNPKGVKDFMEAHCKFSVMFTHSFHCQPDISCEIYVKKNEMFTTIFALCDGNTPVFAHIG